LKQEIDTWIVTFINISVCPVQQFMFAVDVSVQVSRYRFVCSWTAMI